MAGCDVSPRGSGPSRLLLSRNSLHRDQLSSDNLHLYLRKLEQEMTASSRGRRPYNVSVRQCRLSLPKLFARAARGLTASGASSLSITGPAVRIPRVRLRQSAPLVQTAGIKDLARAWLSDKSRCCRQGRACGSQGAAVTCSSDAARGGRTIRTTYEDNGKILCGSDGRY